MIMQADPGAGFRADKDAFLEAVTRVLESGWYVLGEEVAAFEQKFAAWVGLPNAVGCANGTDAIELALRALGASSGKVVFTVSHSAVATVAAVERAGAFPWMVDIEEGRLTMDPAALEAALHQCARTRPDLQAWAILPVHIYGQSADLDPLLALAKHHGLYLIEDCAQSHGAEYHGRKCGTYGHVAAFSLYPTKNLGAFGDAGIVGTPDAELAEKLRYIRQYGWKDRYISSCSGINSRLDPIQAAFLQIKLDRLDRDNAARRTVATLYNELLMPLEQRGLLSLVRPASDCLHSYHQYVIRTARRDSLAEYCSLHGVGTAVHYPLPIHCQPAYLDRNKFPVTAASGSMEALPVTEQAAREVLSLPMHPHLSLADAEQAAAVLLEWGEA